MTDIQVTRPTAEIVDPQVAVWLARYEEDRQRQAALSPLNQAAVFTALAAAGIVEVVVPFDGYGDSGQIESFDARRSMGSVDLPQVDVAFARLSGAPSGHDETVIDLREAIECLAYDLLEQTHGGWENNDGAYGDFTFDVAEATIRLDYHERYTATETYTHSF